jgi:hypothetical protein
MGHEPVGIPNGLTNITIHMQTPEEAEASREAAERRDWNAVDDLKPALILHFGDRQVRFSSNLRSIHRAANALMEIQDAIRSGRCPVPEAPEYDTRPTAWMHLDSDAF